MATTVWAQAQLTISVDSAGTLGTQLTEAVRFTVAALKVSGPLNGADIKILQQMASRSKTRKEGEELLTELDLSEATIVDNKGGFRTRLNQLPPAMFANCKALETVALPDSITAVSKSCFSGCTGLKEITIPSLVTTIDDYAFNACSSLTSLALPPLLQKIENHLTELVYGFGKAVNHHN